MILTSSILESSVLENVIIALMFAWLAVICLLLLRVVIRMRPFDHRRLSNQLTAIMAVSIALILVGVVVLDPPDSWDPLLLLLTLVIFLALYAGALMYIHHSMRSSLRWLSEFFARRMEKVAAQQNQRETTATRKPEGRDAR